MMELSYRRRRFPPVVSQHAVWLYLRFTVSYRDVEDLLAERGLDISYETVRSWGLKFGPVIAQRLRRQPSPPERDRKFAPHLPLWRSVISPASFSECGRLGLPARRSGDGAVSLLVNAPRRARRQECRKHPVAER